MYKVLIIIIFLSNIAFCEEFIDFENFNKFIKNVNEKSDRFEKKEFYYNFTIKKSNQKKDLSKINNNQEKLFYIYEGIVLSDFLLLSESIFQKKLSELKEEKNKEKMEKYIDQLVELRKKHASKLEEVANKLLDEIDLDKKEKDLLLKKIINWNNNQKLIKKIK